MSGLLTPSPPIDVASMALLDLPIYRSGSYYIGMVGGDSSQTPANSTQYATPFPIAQPGFPGIDRIGIEVITIGDVGSTIRLGVIADDPVAGRFPKGAVIFDTVVKYAASIDGHTTGRQEITVNELVGYRGLVWLTLLVESAPVLQPTIKMTSGYYGRGFGAKFSDLANLFGAGYKNEQTDTAITSFIEPPSSTRAAKIYVRVK